MARLHGEGLGRNAIARALDLSAASVTKICREHEPPLEFDRAATALAVRAHQIDLAAERQTLKRMLLVRGREALEAIDAPAIVGQFGGRDNTWSERLVDVPPAADQQRYMTIAAIALQRHADLERVDQSAPDHGGAVGMLEALRDGLTAAVEKAHASGGLPDPTETPDQRASPAVTLPDEQPDDPAGE